MQTPTEDSVASFIATLSSVNIGPIFEIMLLVLAGVCAIAATVILVVIVMVAPIRGVARALRTFARWLRGSDWKPIRSLLLVMAMLGAIGLTSILAAKAIYQADQLAESLLISLLGLGVIVGGWFVLWRLARKAKQAAKQIVGDNTRQSDEPGG